MKRSHLIALIALAVVVVVATVVSVAIFSRRVQVLTGQRIECVYGHVVKDDVKTIEVRPADASKYGVKTTSIVCADHRKAEKLYREAQYALTKGDVKTAKDKLAEVVTIDRGFKSAAVQLSDLDNGKTPKPATDTGSATPDNSTGGASEQGKGAGGTSSETSKTGEPTGPIASLMGWTPDAIDGYAAEEVIADSLTVSREYRAGSGDEGLVIVADQIGSEVGVLDAFKNRVKLHYDQDAKQLKIGTRPAYAGTDGRSVAVVGITDGPVLIVLQLRTPGKDPRGSLDRLIAIAKTLPR